MLVSIYVLDFFFRVMQIWQKKQLWAILQITYYHLEYEIGEIICKYELGNN